jgi:hypothetical protein
VANDILRMFLFEGRYVIGTIIWGLSCVEEKMGALLVHLNLAVFPH